MAIRGGPDISETGLALYLDATNRNSYPGSGTMWSGVTNAVSASLVTTSGPSVTVSSDNLGSLMFNGSSHYADFDLQQSGSILTIEMWAKLQGLPNGAHFSKMFIGWNLYDVIFTNAGLGFNTGNGDVYGISAKQAFRYNMLNNWHHYVFEMSGSSTYTNNKIWIDGESQTLSQQVGTILSGQVGFNNGRGRISGWRNTTGYEMPMSCSAVKIYNRRLTTDEVLQNYNAMRSRYPEPSGEAFVTDGLVLNLDAGNASSYGTSGTTWTDISGNGNNVTLTNGPTYDGTNVGSIVFDGVNDYADFFAPNLGTTTTVEMWARLGTTNLDRMMFGWNLYDIYNDATQGFGYNTGNSDVYGISTATFTSLGLVNNWKHYIFEMRSDVSYTNNKIYINTVSQTLSQRVGTENATTRNFNNGLGRISSWRSNATYIIQMNLGAFRVYNRALTTQEISQNYNALRFRYGL